MVPSRSRRLRPRRSTAQAISMSNLRLLASFSMASSPGRLSRPFAPEMPSSRYTSTTVHSRSLATLRSFCIWLSLDCLSEVDTLTYKAARFFSLMVVFPVKCRVHHTRIPYSCHQTNVWTIDHPQRPILQGFRRTICASDFVRADHAEPSSGAHGPCFAK